MKNAAAPLPLLVWSNCELANNMLSSLSILMFVLEVVIQVYIKVDPLKTFDINMDCLKQ